MNIVEQLEAASEKLLPGYLGISLKEVETERVVGQLTVEEHHCTGGDILHGGTIMALADELGAIGTFMNLAEGSRTSTVESKTNFLKTTKLGDTVTAVSRLVHKGRTLMLWQTEVSRSDGSLVAVVSQSQIVLPRS